MEVKPLLKRKLKIYQFPLRQMSFSVQVSRGGAIEGYKDIV